MKRAIINCGNSIWVLLEGECSEVHPPNVIVGPDILIKPHSSQSADGLKSDSIRILSVIRRRADCAFPSSHSFADAQKSGSIRHPLSFSIRRRADSIQIHSVIRRRADIRLHRILSVSVVTSLQLVTSLEPQTHRNSTQSAFCESWFSPSYSRHADCDSIFILSLTRSFTLSPEIRFSASLPWFLHLFADGPGGIFVSRSASTSMTTAFPLSFPSGTAGMISLGAKSYVYLPPPRPGASEATGRIEISL
ncbi:hypothetical protein B0H17DRAFT_1148564 [Mycena rosella]|uniref:Uncharacterized protein n=1 Tax=Mycena rosella TaxID=1033263 RepID=A0AAD7CAL8_MYCRO|nr:hypothetical protein B0H17DRAFT_1148564 [Mycena rosella]